MPAYLETETALDVLLDTGEEEQFLDWLRPSKSRTRSKKPTRHRRRPRRSKSSSSANSRTPQPTIPRGTRASGQDSLVVKKAIRSGNRNESSLTDLVFNSRHPGRRGKPISASDPDRASMVREWLEILDPLVRPALRVGSAPSTGNSAATTPATVTSPETNFITIRSGVRLTAEIARVVRELDGHFQRAGVRETLTSGVRSPEDQLALIKRFASEKGIAAKYPNLAGATLGDVDDWVPAWDELLQVKDIIFNHRARPKPPAKRQEVLQSFAPQQRARIRPVRSTWKPLPRLSRATARLRLAVRSARSSSRRRTMPFTQASAPDVPARSSGNELPPLSRQTAC